MAKDKEHKKEKKEKKQKKIKSNESGEHSVDPVTISTDIIMSERGVKAQESVEVDMEELYESKLAAQAPFAKPLASKKLNKKVLKTIKKGLLVSHYMLAYS